MTAVTPQGKPSEPPDRPMWPLVAGVGLAAAVLGYLLGAAGARSAPPPSIFVQAPTTSSTIPATIPTVASVPVGEGAPVGVPLSELVPGLQGTLVAVVDPTQTQRLAMTQWFTGADAPVTVPIPELYSVALNTSGPVLFAGWGASAMDSQSTLYVGRLHAARADVLPIALGAEAMAWHQSDPFRLAWIQGTPDNRVGELRTVTLNARGGVTSSGVVASVSGGTWIESWGDWGFVLGTGNSVDGGAETCMLDPGGVGRWRIPYVGVRVISASGLALVEDYQALDGLASRWLAPVEAISDRRALDWLPDDHITASPDGRRIARLAWDTNTLEVRNLDGEPLVSFYVAGYLHGLAWSDDGRFVLTLTQSGKVGFYDTNDGSVHHVDLGAHAIAVSVRLLFTP
jgi:hypothetical protein